MPGDDSSQDQAKEQDNDVADCDMDAARTLMSPPPEETLRAVREPGLHSATNPDSGCPASSEHPTFSIYHLDRVQQAQAHPAGRPRSRLAHASHNAYRQVA